MMSLNNKSEPLFQILTQEMHTAKIKRKNEHADFSGKYDESIEKVEWKRFFENQAYLKRKDFLSTPAWIGE